MDVCNGLDRINRGVTLRLLLSPISSRPGFGNGSDWGRAAWKEVYGTEVLFVGKSRRYQFERHLPCKREKSCLSQLRKTRNGILENRAECLPLDRWPRLTEIQ